MCAFFFSTYSSNVQIGSLLLIESSFVFNVSILEDQKKNKIKNTGMHFAKINTRETIINSV